MSIYEQGLRSISGAETGQIGKWIKSRDSELSSSPLDSSYTSSRFETDALVAGLYLEGSETDREKIVVALADLLDEAVDNENYQLLETILFAIGRTGCDFDLARCISFLNLKANESDIREIKINVLALLQGRIRESLEVQQAFMDWYKKDLVAIGNEHALQLFAGLISFQPEMLSQHLDTLLSINESLIEQDKFSPKWILAAIVENCGVEVLEKHLESFPSEVKSQFVELRKQFPQIFQ